MTMVMTRVYIPHTTQAIKFLCSDVAGYPHVMTDDSICLHPDPNEDFADKLVHELSLLQEWVQKYFVNEETDEYYEFPIIPSEKHTDIFYFTDTDLPIKRKSYTNSL